MQLCQMTQLEFCISKGGLASKENYNKSTVTIKEEWEIFEFSLKYYWQEEKYKSGFGNSL